MGIACGNQEFPENQEKLIRKCYIRVNFHLQYWQNKTKVRKTFNRRVRPIYENYKTWPKDLKFCPSN